MNTKKYMVIDNKTNEIISPNIENYKYNPQTHKYDITFNSGKTFGYGYNRISILKDPVSINPNSTKLFIAFLCLLFT